MRSNWLGAIAAIAAIFVSAGAVAQDYPSRQIQMVIPFPPGGNTDLMARTLSARAPPKHSGSRLLSSTRAAPAAPSAISRWPMRRPDGYTLGTHAQQPAYCAAARAEAAIRHGQLPVRLPHLLRALSADCIAEGAVFNSSPDFVDLLAGEEGQSDLCVAGAGHPAASWNPVGTQRDQGRGRSTSHSPAPVR